MSTSVAVYLRPLYDSYILIRRDEVFRSLGTVFVLDSMRDAELCLYAQLRQLGVDMQVNS